MKPSDFHIGLEFACGPFWWRCTDIGTRTVTAIRLVDDDPAWYAGPPYMIEEEVLDEIELGDAFLTHEDAIRASMAGARKSGYPNTPHEAVKRMMDEKIASFEDEPRYPRARKRLLRIDRVRADGEILHPYAARRDPDGGAWMIRIYMPFTKEWAEIDECEFLGLPLSTPESVRKRANLMK